MNRYVSVEPELTQLSELHVGAEVARIAGALIAIVFLASVAFMAWAYYTAGEGRGPWKKN